MSELWLPPAAVVPQEYGPDWFDSVDGMEWSRGRGFYRGFSTSFALRPGKDAWFHFPFPVVAGTIVERFRLLWETGGDARLGWVICHHGGAERLPLTERLAPVPGVAEPFAPPEQWRQYYPAMDRRLSDFPVPAPFPARFGLQLCVLATGGSDGGIVRFYGAALVTGDPAAA